MVTERKVKLMEEKKFPIYKFYANWDQDDFENNSTGYSIMYKEYPSPDQLEEELKLFKYGILAKHKNVIFKMAEYEFVEEESWCSGWFSHYTYNQLENVSEIESSFEDFVERKEQSNKKNGHGTLDSNPNSKEPYHCLMGAEDRYRWKICRCDGCKKLGKITVDH